MGTGVSASLSRSHAGLGALSSLFSSEAWRYTGPFTRFNRFKNAFPGLGIATVAFAVYCGYEYVFLKEEPHSEGGHH
jgi:NADH dehydrogenase (ubiquinone) 1 beta subcomplex subunit 3